MGSRVETWVVGQDIDEDTYENFLDPATQELYALVHFEKDAPVTSVLKKEMYDFAKERVGEPLSEKDLGSITDKIMDDLGWGLSMEKEEK